MANLISVLLFCAMLLALGYLVLPALASIRPPGPVDLESRQPSRRFCVLIPAHNEAAVIGATIKQLLAVDYPSDLCTILVVADHCTDETALLARQAGAVVCERKEGLRTGKGAALGWLLKQALSRTQFDAVVILDADTRVDPYFLRIMDLRLHQGFKAIQGQHVISNPTDGLFPTLVWSMFLVDNRFQNLGRCNLGWSARNMGDSICFSADLLREMGWPDSLTEDYEFRQRLLLAGIRIVYEPAAVGYGEAPLSWSEARAQRLRWLRGTYKANKGQRRKLLAEGIKRRNGVLMDAALQGYLPSFSTLAVTGLTILSGQLLTNGLFGPVFSTGLIKAWLGLVGALLLYPLFGLVLERAPSRAYLIVLLGPPFVLWRSGLAVIARFGGMPATWVRTVHGRAGDVGTK